MPRRYAANDRLIDELLADQNYSVREDGSIWRRHGDIWKRTGLAKTDKQGKHYNHLKFHGHMLLVHRIIYRKFNGPLDPEMVVNHIDGNSLNNHPSNLELVTQEINRLHCTPAWVEGNV